MKALAVDLGGSHASCALIDERTIIVQKSISYTDNESLMQILPRLHDTIRSIINEQNLNSSDLAGLAIGYCGLVNTDERCVLSTKGRFADGHEINLRAWTRENFSLELFIENDARMALLGEWFAGSGRGSNELVMMTLGTGVGGAAMIEGRLLRGKHFQAGCLGGHMPIQLNGRKCPCGNIGCVEAHASTSTLPEICNDWPGANQSAVATLTGKHFGFREIVELRNNGDKIAGEIFNSCIQAWAAGAVALIHAYDPERVIIGGGVIEGCGDEIISAVQSHVNQHAWTPWGKVSVQAAELGNRAALLGAIPLIQGARP